MRYTELELKMAFEKVENKSHWKGPIKAVIHESEIEKTAAAVMFYTATEMTVLSRAFGLAEVAAPGYYAGPAN